MILLGSSLFLLYGGLLSLDGPASWPKKLPLWAVLAIVVAAPLQFFTQTAMLAGFAH